MQSGQCSGLPSGGSFLAEMLEQERRGMPKKVTDDDVAKHDNTLEPDPDPIVNGDDAGLSIALPMKRKLVDKDEEEGDDSPVTEKE